MGASGLPAPGTSPGQLPRLLRERQVNCVIAGGAGPMAQNMPPMMVPEQMRALEADV